MDGKAKGRPCVIFLVGLILILRWENKNQVDLQSVFFLDCELQLTEVQSFGTLYSRVRVAFG